MDLRLDKNAVFCKDTFCLSKKKCTNRQNIHDALVYKHENPHKNWCLLQFSWKWDGFESKYCSALIVVAKIASAKLLIFVLALAVALATASATKNWDLYYLSLLILTGPYLVLWLFSSPDLVLVAAILLYIQLYIFLFLTPGPNSIQCCLMRPTNQSAHSARLQFLLLLCNN